MLATSSCVVSFEGAAFLCRTRRIPAGFRRVDRGSSFVGAARSTVSDYLRVNDRRRSAPIAGLRGAKGASGLRMAGTHYEILGVKTTADAGEIKRAYRRMALKKHPDTNKSPTAKEEFSAVVRAYEVLCDEKRRKEYDRKLRFTSPFGAGGSGRAGSSSASSASSSWRAGARSTYDPSREEAARRWREANPTPADIDDSFGDIFRDLVGGIASMGGRAVLNDLVDFLEKGVDGFSSDTSADFEDLMAGNNLEEMEAELENSRFLLEQLEKRAKQLELDRMTSEKEVAAARAGPKRAMTIEELDQQMATVERAAGIKARSEEMQGHVKRAKARIARLERKITELSRGASTGDYYNTRSSRGSSTPSSSTSSQRTPGSTTRRSDGQGGDTTSGSAGARGAGGAGRSARPPRSPRNASREKRRADNPSVEEELAKMKRDMGLG